EGEAVANLRPSERLRDHPTFDHELRRLEQGLRIAFGRPAPSTLEQHLISNDLRAELGIELPIFLRELRDLAVIHWRELRDGILLCEHERGDDCRVILDDVGTTDPERPMQVIAVRVERRL